MKIMPKHCVMDLKTFNESIYLWEHKTVIWEAGEAIVWLRKQMQCKLIERKEK